MDKGVIALILVGALVLVAAFQTFQLLTISNAIGSANLGVSTAPSASSSNQVKTTTTPSSSGSPSGGGNLENLPSMVGGC